MKIRTKLIIGSFVIVVPALVIGYFSVTQLDKIAEPLDKDIPFQIETLSDNSYLDSLAHFIRYYDEVLTQSARNYAFTQDEKWKTRYNEIVSELDSKIKEAIDKGSVREKIFFDEVDTANEILVIMEEYAIKLVDEEKVEEAIEILESDEYWKQKNIYNIGLVKYVENRGADYNQVLVTSTEIVDLLSEESQDLISYSQTFILILVGLSVLLAIIFGIIVSYLITKPLEELMEVVEIIAGGDLNRRVDIKSKDEIGHLARDFNKMADFLRESQNNIEHKVEERTAELEKLNSSMVGRELKMVELKKEINRIKNGK